MNSVTAADITEDLAALDGLIDGGPDEGLGVVLAPVRDHLAALARLLAAAEAHRHGGGSGCCVKELTAALSAGKEDE